MFSVTPHPEQLWLWLGQRPSTTWYYDSHPPSLSHLKMPVGGSLTCSKVDNYHQSVELLSSFPASQISKLTLFVNYPTALSPFPIKILESPNLERLRRKNAVFGAWRIWKKLVVLIVAQMPVGDIGRSEELRQVLRSPGYLSDYGTKNVFFTVGSREL